MSLEYNPNKLLKEAKNRVKKNSAKKSFSKSIKKIIVTIICTAIVASLSVFLSKAGIELEPEQKSELIKILVEVILGGGALGLAALFSGDILKKRK